MTKLNKTVIKSFLNDKTINSNAETGFWFIEVITNFYQQYAYKDSNVEKNRCSGLDSIRQ